MGFTVVQSAMNFDETTQIQKTMTCKYVLSAVSLNSEEVRRNGTHAFAIIVLSAFHFFLSVVCIFCLRCRCVAFISLASCFRLSCALLWCVTADSPERSAAFKKSEKQTVFAIPYEVE